jgi:hypothetical protein
MVHQQQPMVIAQQPLSPTFVVQTSAGPMLVQQQQQPMMVLQQGQPLLSPVLVTVPQPFSMATPSMFPPAAHPGLPAAPSTAATTTEHPGR